jgi:hypothetical protein
MATFNFFGTEIIYDENEFSDEETFVKLYKYFSTNKVKNEDKTGKLHISFMLPIKDWKNSFLGLCCLPQFIQITETPTGGAHVTVWYQEDESKMINSALYYIMKGHHVGLYLQDTI